MSLLANDSGPTSSRVSGPKRVSEPVAKLVATVTLGEAGKVPRLGTLRGTVLSMEHFDDPLEEFEEYR